ncbi:histidine-containing phosphotransfer protein 5-like [Rhodamnia argentea]|uniref:Histidine-containing phosphotransfer protein n=1 Tax=Rhodamnia argentea TaxID=178133 RepID=A0A8B8NIZ4_9MYRT|nr:histidine-containing phosphotransfer protein 5-like [Rhodamnia argentea]
MAHRRLQNYIDTLKNEGIMDGEYEESRRVQSGSNLPNFMMDLINSFLRDGDNSMRELADLLSSRNVDFAKVTRAAHLIKGGGNSLGGCRVVAAARALINASLVEDKQSCETSYEQVVNEYYHFRDKLRTLYQMERAVINNESRRRG